VEVSTARFGRGAEREGTASVRGRSGFAHECSTWDASVCGRPNPFGGLQSIGRGHIKAIIAPVYEGRPPPFADILTDEPGASWAPWARCPMQHSGGSTAKAPTLPLLIEQADQVRGDHDRAERPLIAPPVPCPHAVRRAQAERAAVNPPQLQRGFADVAHVGARGLRVAVDVL